MNKAKNKNKKDNKLDCSMNSGEYSKCDTNGDSFRFFLDNNECDGKDIENIKLTNNIKKFASDENNLKYIESNYMSYYPLHLKEIIFKNELIWIIPGLKHNFIWENNCFEKIRYLINQILDDNSITNEEINYIISSINKRPNIIKNINLTPEQMMQLIEKDESLSSEILLIICKTSLNE